VAVVATVADLGEPVEAAVEAVVVAVAAEEAVAEAVGAIAAVAAVAVAIETAAIASVSNGNQPASILSFPLRARRTFSPDLRLGDEFDFDSHVAGQTRYLNGRAGGRRLSKIPAIDFVHRGKIAHVGQEDSGLEHFVER
jgi:hypothetical protein